MKRLALIAVIICGCILTACDNNDDETHTLGYERDNTLAGSISFAGYKMVANGVYEENVLDGFQYNLSHITIDKVSDTEVMLFCYSKWGETTIKVLIPVILVSGEPHNVTFDYSSNDAMITYDDVESPLSGVTINGWIKEVLADESSNNGGDEDPATPHYLCDIVINCAEVLTLEITSVTPQ